MSDQDKTEREDRADESETDTENEVEGHKLHAAEAAEAAEEPDVEGHSFNAAEAAEAAE